MDRVLRSGLAGLFLAAAALATTPPPTNPAWEKLKTLVGEWTGADVRLSYELVSGGTGLLETMNSGHDENMITVYHLDGNRILATHYCSAGNQPRMAAVGLSPDGRRLTFGFVDATNVGADSEVMKGLVVTFESADRLTQSWTSTTRTGKDQVGTFTYSRVRQKPGAR